mgnify:CR=1 FL=1
MPKLNDERNALYETIKANREKIRALRDAHKKKEDAYYERERLWRAYLKVEKQKQWEAGLEERKAREAAKKQWALENAPEPFEAEVTAAEQLIAYLAKWDTGESEARKAEAAARAAADEARAAAARAAEEKAEAAFAGMSLTKKAPDENMFGLSSGTGARGKKGKKFGKKPAAGRPEGGGSIGAGATPAAKNERLQIPFDAYGGFDSSPRWTVLLDRDGVLNEDVGSPGVVREEQFSLLPGVADAVTALKKDGHACMVVTNQNARRKGLLSATTLDAVHASLRSEVPVDDIFVATGLDGPALKPAPDLLNLALGDADRDRAVLVGDARTDMIAACRAGVLAVLVTSSHHGVACAAELAEAPTPAVIDGGAPGGLLRDGAGRVDAVFPGLPQALAAIRAHASITTCVN